MRIQGKGFFVVGDNGALSYTRADAFKMNKNDYIVDNEGNRLQGYGVNAKGDAVNGGRTNLKIDTSRLQKNRMAVCHRRARVSISKKHPTQSSP